MLLSFLGKRQPRSGRPLFGTTCQELPFRFHLVPTGQQSSRDHHSAAR